jgi:perosamine synthetase
MEIKSALKELKVIPVNEPVLGEREMQLLNQCIDTGWISSEGPFVKEFEVKFADHIGRKYGVAVCNGSAALDIAVSALNLKQGDEIIMPTFTIISCAAAILRAGAKPVLVDADPYTWNMDAAQIERKITSKTKAIMVVHIYGMPVDMDPVLQIAEKYNLKIIEDAAEAIGQNYKNQACGSFGDISTFSFYPNKHITTGEGGMVLTSDNTIAERCRSLRNLCFKPEARFVHQELGWNYRMTNLQAAVGIAQLERLDGFIEKKKHIGKKYTELLSDLDGIDIPVSKTPYAENIYWVYGIVLREYSNCDAVRVMKALKEKGVGTRPFFWPMHQQPVFDKMGLFANESHPVAEKIARRGFYIPSGLALTDEQIETVVQILGEIIE